MAIVRTWIRCGVCRGMRKMGLDNSWTCAVCRRTFCGDCRSVHAGNYEQPHVCAPCGERKDVFGVLKRAAGAISEISARREAALEALQRRKSHPTSRPSAQRNRT